MPLASKILLSLLLGIFSSLNLVYGQWKVYSRTMTSAQELYSIHQEAHIRSYPFYFPEVLSTDTTDGIGYEILRSKDTVWSRNTNIRLNLRNDCLHLKFYSENISLLSISLFDATGREYVGDLIVENEKYHTPIRTELGLWAQRDDRTILLRDYPQDTFRLTRFTITVKQIDPKRPHRLVFADLSLYRPVFEKINVIHPFFDALTKTSSLTELPYNSFTSEKGTPFLLNTFDQYSLISQAGNNFELEYNGPHSRRKALYEFASLLFDRYPFYAERGLDKDKLKWQLYTLFAEENSQEQLIQKLGELISLFRDPHFFLQQPSQQNPQVITSGLRSGPVSLQKFYNNIYVAGVYDTLLSQTLPVGSRVLTVDGVEIDTLLDSLSRNYPGTQVNRQSKALSRLLYRRKSECTTLKAVSGTDTIEVTLAYDRKNLIPPNFKPIHREYKLLTNDIAYYRLNTWRSGEWLNFYNHIDDLKKRKGLIIDLRNNGGGYGIEGIRIASAFIRRPQVYSHSVFSWDETNAIRETAVIRPHPTVDLSHLEIIILGNERTACASEIFLDFMQRHAGARFVGTSRTAGAFANLSDVTLDSLSITFNSTVKVLTGDKKCIENTGIEPDIYVTISQVKELYPYDDKVLQTGIYLLSK